MSQTTIERAALGRSAKLGAFYDICTDSFLHDNLFGSKVDDEAISTTRLGDTSLKLVTTDSLQERFKKLDVGADLQVSVLSGLVEASGSGAYLTEERDSDRAQCMSLLCKLRTVNEEIIIRQNKDIIDIDALEEQAANATHVVVAIDWGAVCTVSCECESKEDEDVSMVKGALTGVLEKLKALVDVQGYTKAPREQQNREAHRKFSFKCKADVSAPDKDLPVTYEGAVEMVKSLPSLVKNTNDGKGVPLTYSLMPLNSIVRMLKLQFEVPVRYGEINEDIVNKCVEIFVDFTKKKQTLVDVQNEMHAFENYVAEERFKEIEDILQQLNGKISDFKQRLQSLIKDVRSQRREITSIDTFVSEEHNETWYSDQIQGFHRELSKLKSITSWKDRGIMHVGKHDELRVDYKGYVYVFYKGDNDDDKDVDKNRELFFRLQKTHAEDKFIVVDQAIREDLWPAGEKTTIYMYANGRLVTTDLLTQESKDSEMCLIKPAAPTHVQIRPTNRTHVRLRCPNAFSKNRHSTGDPTSWVCFACRDVVEYGIDSKCFFCKCGEFDPRKALFRCNDARCHGTEYVKYPVEILDNELSQHQAMKEKNILILGETGVGKSTWINGFVNYMYFAGLEEASEATDFHVLIPSSFTFTQGGQAKEIMIGEKNENEILEVGKSATKEPRSYVFHVGENKVRLIDTPGVGDVDGLEQDKKNFDNILSYLTNYQDIHAVCILLKPNNSRLTAMFRFCIQELLTHLHASVKDNIVFCFTNARATFYQPGDTLPALNKELRQREVGIEATPSNYFCFDNEPFRFLACLKNGVKFNQEEMSTYATSWKKSVEETKRLLEHIDRLRPQKVRNTLSLNEARRTIVAMSKPLAEVARTIEQNVQRANDAKRQIDLCKETMVDLKNSLKFNGYDLRRIELDNPRTVCAHSDCVKYVPVGEDKVQNKIHVQICHDQCRLEGIPTETTNDARLQGCLCMQGDTTCHECGHHYTHHMHITYDMNVVTVDFLSKEVQAEIIKKQSVKDKKAALIHQIDVKIKELKDEEKTIMKTSAKYGSFLKANALIAYNDAVGDYLDMSIEQERMKAREIRSDVLLKKLQEMKDEYIKEREILDKAIGTENGDNIKTPEKVAQLQQELFSLKHMGKTLQDFFEGISISHSANNINFQETVAPIRQSDAKERDKSSRTLLGRAVESFKWLFRR